MSGFSPNSRLERPPFIIADWRVEPRLNRLCRGGTSVRVEPKVMEVLLCLAEAPGEVVTRETLLGRVWPDVTVSDDALSLAVSKLRKALGDDRRAPRFVETISKGRLPPHRRSLGSRSRRRGGGIGGSGPTFSVAAPGPLGPTPALGPRRLGSRRLVGAIPSSAGGE